MPSCFAVHIVDPIWPTCGPRPRIDLVIRLNERNRSTERNTETLLAEKMFTPTQHF